MSRELFGTDGIRGTAYEWPLDEEGMEQIGRAVGTQFAEKDEYIMLGYDTRESSPVLAEAFSKGVAATGVHVENLGVVPTPGLAYLTNIGRARAGAMITASHNPFQDNGIKVFNEHGRKLSDEQETNLNGLITGKRHTGARRGDVIDASERTAEYRKFLINSTDVNFEGLTIALDTANGAASAYAGRVFSELGARVGVVANQPDGYNINEKCGATSIELLQDTVYAGHYDMGFAFDGDADRLIAVDENGNQLNGDHIMYILATTMGYDKVVATDMTNMGMEKALTGRGHALHRTKVGDRYVLEGMEQTGALLGGEQSGHIILADKFWAGDGMLAAIQLARAVKTQGKSLAQWNAEIPMLEQTIINIPTPHKDRVGDLQIAAYVADQTEALGGLGRVNVRASGTEQMVRVMVESNDAARRAESIAVSIGHLLANVR